MLPYYSLLTLSEFGNRPHIDLDLPEKLYSRYHVIDWDEAFVEFHTLQSFLSWLAEIYVYGEVGLLNYRPSGHQRYNYPPVTVGSFEGSLSHFSSTTKLPLDEVVLVSLSNYSC